MTGQATFIATVRRALSDGIPHNPIRPLPTTPNDPIDYTADLPDPVAAFERAAAAVGAEVLMNAGPRELLDRVLDEVSPRIVAVSSDPECDEIAEFLAKRNTELVPQNDVAAVATADLGITGALAGVALTGSLVVDAQRARGRLVSLLPKVHLALLSRHRIVPTPGDVLRDVAKFFPGRLPSNIVLITGPSRSADIELEITEGVHGPQRVMIGLID